MAIPFLVTSAKVKCPHGGTVSLASSSANSAVQAGGNPVCLETDVHTVAGCAFTVPPGKPQPCVTVRWSAAASQCKVNGVGILTQASVGICYSGEQIPQGPAVIASTQTAAGGL
jgi:hypothetical protein